MIKVSIIFTVGALFTAFNTFGSNNPTFSKVRIKDPNFEKALKESSHIMEGILDVIEVEGKKYMISVGTSSLPKTTTPEKMLSALSYSRLMAKRQFSEMLNLVMTAKESFVAKYETIYQTDENGKTETIERVMETFTSFIQTKSKQYIRSPEQKEIGWWISEDRTLLYAGIAYPM